DWHHPRDLVERVLDLKRSAFRVGELALDVTYDTDVPMLLCDGPQIQQALLNVLINAEQALAGRSDPRVMIHVYAAGTPIDPPHVLARAAGGGGGVEGGRMVVFDRADNGPGLPPQIVDRLFEPFVTTRPVGQGTGMGLAISYAIITQHGGSLQAASAP